MGEISSGMGGIVEPCVMIVLLHGLDAELEDIVVTWKQERNKGNSMLIYISS